MDCNVKLFCFIALLFLTSCSNKNDELFKAITENDGKQVKILLESGVHINSNLEGYTPLGLASFHGHIDIVQLLLKNGADIYKTSINGQSSLFIASTMGHIDIVELLLKNNAKINLGDDFLNTALMTASFHRYPKIVKLLLSNGADINLKNKKGNTALMKIALAYNRRDMLNLLIDNGADINLKNKKGNTALIFAAQYGQLDNVKVLLQSNAKVSAHDIHLIQKLWKEGFRDYNGIKRYTRYVPETAQKEILNCLNKTAKTTTKTPKK